MLLALDVGNTNIKIGVFDGGNLLCSSRIATDSSRMEDQYAIEINNILNIYNIICEDINGAVIGSVVPQLTDKLFNAVKHLFGIGAIIVGYNSSHNLNITISHPEGMGADLIAGCVGAKELYSESCIVIDMGTATKMLVIDKDGYMCGGAIIPGLGISLDALVSRAALLSSISLDTPKNVIGSNTTECIQSGVIYGTAAMLDGLCEKFENELGYSCKVVATGGLAKTVMQSCNKKIEFNENLVLDGLRVIYEKSI